MTLQMKDTEQCFDMVLFIMSWLKLLRLWMKPQFMTTNETFCEALSFGIMLFRAVLC